MLTIINYLNSKKKAFTLAEVLISLAVIGIIAAITITSIINIISDIQNKNAYKAAFSTLNQAFLMAQKNNELVAVPPSNAVVEKAIDFYYVKSHFTVVKSCGSVTSSGGLTTADITSCWATGEYVWTSYPIASDDIAFVDNAGMSWSYLGPKRADAGWVLYFLVDTNGLKGPNQFGLDRMIIFSGDGSSITPSSDILSTANGNYPSVCPSVAKHPCYYTSWLLGVQ